MSLKLNPDITHVKNILNATTKNDGYCPCQIEKTEQSICPLISLGRLPLETDSSIFCVTGQIAKECHCGVYL